MFSEQKFANVKKKLEVEKWDIKTFIFLILTFFGGKLKLFVKNCFRDSAFFKLIFLKSLFWVNPNFKNFIFLQEYSKTSFLVQIKFITEDLEQTQTQTLIIN